MSKYRVGDELLVVHNPNEDAEKLKKNSFLTVKDNFSTFSWCLKILNIEYNAPGVTVTYQNPRGEIGKVYASCKKDLNEFDKQMVLEKALLKAYLNEISELSTLRDNNLSSFK